jgi:plastocyanin
MRRIARCLVTAGIVSATVGLAARSASAGGGCHSPLSDAAGVHVEISSLCFNPTVIRVRPGTTVDWVNHDATDHTVTALGDAFDANLQDGMTASQRFAAAGTFPYYCRLHPGMVGVVVVAGSTDVAPPRAQPLIASRSITAASRPARGVGWLGVGLAIAITAGATGLLSSWYWRRVSRRARLS